MTLYYSDDGPGSYVSPDVTKREAWDGTVSTLTIDDLVTSRGLPSVDFIKMDIEGAELAALQGAEESIRKYRPKLAISLYHALEDFDTIPRYLSELELDYTFYLGHHTIYENETVLYAVPDRLSQAAPREGDDAARSNNDQADMPGASQAGKASDYVDAEGAQGGVDEPAHDEPGDAKAGDLAKAPLGPNSQENSVSNWAFEETKDTPFGQTTDAAANQFLRLGYEPSDYYNFFPCFVNARILARYMSFYELYKATLGLAGHIAEVGVFRGAVSMFFAKLMLLHEPQTITQVHGFDWWRDPNSEQEVSSDIERGPDYDYLEPYDRITKMIEAQGLQRWAVMHRLNIVTDLEPFFEQHSHLQFKLVFLDAGDYDIVARSIREFWPRLLPGGIMMFDQFNHEVAPGETRAVRELLPEDAVIRSLPHGWMPTAYVVKGETAVDAGGGRGAVHR